MKTFEIVAKKREVTGKKGTKKLRAEDNIPCVLYGGGSNAHFYADSLSFLKLIYTNNVYIVDLNIEGDRHKAILKEIQFHPVNDKVIHIDFIEVFDDQPAIVSIPVEITGNSIGVRNGGKLRQRRRTIKVKGLINDMPDTLNVDISDLTIGGAIRVKDLSFDKLELLDPKQSMVVGVVSSRLAAKGGPVVEAPEEKPAEAAEAKA